MKSFIRYFLQGLLILVPVAITVFVIVEIFLIVNKWFSKLGLLIDPLVDPILVIVAVVLFIFVAGYLSTTIVFKPLFSLFDHAMERAPFIKTVYSSIKDLFSAIVGSKKKFDKPVLVTNKQTGMQQLGFVTNSDLGELGIKEDKVAVYIPYSYSFSGILYVVPKELITPVDASTADVMKFVLSGGITDID